MQLIFVYCLDAGSGLFAKSCPTLVTPWTVACHAPLSYELLICLVVIALNRVLKIYYEVMLSLKATFQFSFLILTIHTHTHAHIYMCVYIYIYTFFLLACLIALNGNSITVSVELLRTNKLACFP